MDYQGPWGESKLTKRQKVLNELKETIRYRELLVNLVVRDIKVRYKNSVMGFFWSLLNPLLQVAVITFAFKGIMRYNVPNYSAYLLCAFLPWTFFQMSVLDASSAVIYHANLVKKTYFPREILPISIVISNLIHFILALLVFFVYLLVLGTPILATWFLLPVVVCIQFLLNMGVAFFVASLNVFYEDIKYMATVLLNLLLFTLPIFYLIETVKGSSIPTAYRPLVLKLFYWNPLAYLITTYRKILLPPFNVAATSTSPAIHDIPLSYAYLGLAALTSLIIFIAGYAFFNSRKWKFAERL